ncbi:MAG: MFS transporter [Planctomycetes bacterium]|nr:MFS transporter [Planctomycetota bacterium]
MGSEAAPPGGRPTNVRWVVFSLAFGTSWLLYLHRYALNILMPEFKEEFGWSDEQLGWLDSAFFLCYMIFQVPFGIFADTFGTRWFLAGMILLWSVVLGLHVLTGSLAALVGLHALMVMIGLRGLFGLGQAGAYAILSRVTRFWFPLSVRTSVQGWIAVFAGRIGGASASLLLATFLLGMLHLSWRSSLLLFALIGVTLAVLFWLFFRDTPRQHPWVNEEEALLIEEGPVAGKRKISIREMFQRMKLRALLNLLVLNMQSFLSTVADLIYASWLHQFLVKTYGMGPTERGWLVMGVLLAGACGGPIGGYLNDYLIRRTGNRRWARRVIGLAGKGTAGVLLLGGILFCFDNPIAFCTVLFFVKLFSDWSLAGTWGTVTDIGGRATATVFAYNNTVASIGGVVGSPLIGRLAAAQGWISVFQVIVGVYVLCASSWLLIDCTIPLLAERESDPLQMSG